MAPRRSWDYWLAEYKQKKENGLPSSLHSRGLRSWVTCNREASTTGTLSDERVEKLNGVGFVWNQKNAGQFFVDHDEWNRKLELLKAHHHEKGNSHGPFQDKQFDQWVRHQRTALKNKESLSEVQQERWGRLNALGFWGETKQQREPSRSAGRRSHSTPRASLATVSVSASAMSNGEMGQGQQSSGIARITVRHRYICRSNFRCVTQAYHGYLVACISKRANGIDNGNHQV
jgi:Helicase associated domain